MRQSDSAATSVGQTPPLLVGRNERKLQALAAEHGLDRWTTSLLSGVGA